MTLYRNITPNVIEYYGESAEDLAKMPTTTKLGEKPYNRVLVPEGTRARILTNSGLRYYMLRSTGWVDITIASGGSDSGSSSGQTISYNDLTDKPAINGVVLGENTTLTEIANSPEITGGEITEPDNTDFINSLFGD